MTGTLIARIGLRDAANSLSKPNCTRALYSKNNHELFLHVLMLVWCCWFLAESSSFLFLLPFL
jgi:hypothetical protein